MYSWCVEHLALQKLNNELSAAHSTAGGVGYCTPIDMMS